MNYWIICMTEDNVRISLAERMIGFGEHRKTRAKAFKVGDLLVFYASKESLTSLKSVGKLIGLATIKGDSYQASEPLWNNGMFPVRVKIEPFSDKSCDIRSLIQKLGFIKNKAKWGSALMPGIIRIAKEDFE